MATAQSLPNSTAWPESLWSSVPGQELIGSYTQGVRIVRASSNSCFIIGRGFDCRQQIGIQRISLTPPRKRLEIDQRVLIYAVECRRARI